MVHPEFLASLQINCWNLPNGTPRNGSVVFGFRLPRLQQNPAATARRERIFRRFLQAGAK